MHASSNYSSSHIGYTYYQLTSTPCLLTHLAYEKLKMLKLCEMHDFSGGMQLFN